MKEVAGKVAFVTGGASGIGLAMVRSFSAAGMKVVVGDIEQDALAAVERSFENSNAEVHTIAVDVTDRDAMAAAADEAEATFGKIHVLCNNAGVALVDAIENADYRDWDWLIGVNLNGVVNGLQTFLPRIRRHGEGGHIVNTASLAGVTSIPGFGVYNATKWAVVGISETLRKEQAANGIGVSVLCPGIVNTNIGAADRNRPVELVTGRPSFAASPKGLDIQTLEGVLDPSVVGDMVLTAIVENDLYIFTHPELQPMSDARFEEMNSAFGRWRSWREAHGV
jgi:NADP-dependent 3-hydroxy acid dehydrogenase YdfG